MGTGTSTRAHLLRATLPADELQAGAVQLLQPRRLHLLPRINKPFAQCRQRCTLGARGARLQLCHPADERDARCLGPGAQEPLQGADAVGGQLGAGDGVLCLQLLEQDG